MPAAVFALDASCMVAAVCAWHEHHRAAAQAVSSRLERGDRMSVAAHALLETYAVLTRLPAPHRLSPGDAWTLVHENFERPATVVALTAREQRTLLHDLAGRQVAGGRTYDELIAACARKAKAGVLLTFTPRHFGALPPRIDVVVPAG